MHAVSSLATTHSASSSSSPPQPSHSSPPASRAWSRIRAARELGKPQSSWSTWRLELRHTTSDASGNYRFVSLAPGNYKVTVEAAGFSKSEVNVTLLTEQNLNVPINRSRSAP